MELDLDALPARRAPGRVLGPAQEVQRAGAAVLGAVVRVVAAAVPAEAGVLAQHPAQALDDDRVRLDQAERDMPFQLQPALTGDDARRKVR
ncbi:hypothetical protein I6A84_02720 [Frankia sp. CNm7]|uniref:hypothetical protein n=1 Tax=Frankia nepalensis TaxID=1836974 RepID=UPI001931E698|nr:hypothetical protein [Frankia nepalensis]MBL7517067.1 hypothetical protein [Frankia nepalensis]